MSLLLRLLYSTVTDDGNNDERPLLVRTTPLSSASRMDSFHYHDGHVDLGACQSGTNIEKERVISRYSPPPLVTRVAILKEERSERALKEVAVPTDVVTSQGSE